MGKLPELIGSFEKLQRDLLFNSSCLSFKVTSDYQLLKNDLLIRTISCF